MPTPKKGESKDEFISRCMGYDDMQKYDSDQRAAICYSKWNEENQEQVVDDDDEEDAWGNVGTPYKCMQCGGRGEEYTDETCMRCGGYGWLNEQSNNAQVEVKKVSKPSKASNKNGEYFITKSDKIYIGSSNGNPNWIKKDSMIHSSDWEGGVLMSKQQANKKAQELEQMNESTRITEKAKSKDQQQLMGMVYAYKKGELKNAPQKVKKIAKGMSLEDAKEYAETKHKGLPTHVSEDQTSNKPIEQMTDPNEIDKLIGHHKQARKQGNKTEQNHTNQTLKRLYLRKQELEDKSTKEAARSMSFEDFLRYTTPKPLNEENNE